jgi:hypothetical protein
VADAIPLVLTDGSEDFAKASWDFWRSDDTPVDTIGEMSRILCVGRIDAAAMVMTYPHRAAVPTKLVMEAQGVLSGN